MMQVNFTEAGGIGKETSVRRRESKFGKGEGICREKKSKTSPFPQLHRSLVGPIGKSPRSLHLA